MPYEYLDHPAPVGGRIHFRRKEDDDDHATYVPPATLAKKGIAFAYLDAARVNEYEALNGLGRQLGMDNLPYDPNPGVGMTGWHRFMDDLLTMAEQKAGLVIIVDNAANLFATPGSWAFELITIWVMQLPRWQQRRVPCHLAFQMETDPAATAIYGRS